MHRLSATEAARRFSELLDAVEARGETFVVARHGRPVARIGPVAAAHGRDVKALLAGSARDSSWPEELRSLRAGLVAEERAWND